MFSSVFQNGIKRWQRLHTWPRPKRWLLKGVLFLIVIGLTLYPKPWLLPVWVARLSDMDSILDARHPGLAILEHKVRAKLTADAAPDQVLAVVQETIYDHVPYAWDWDTWGVMDYLPTVAEVLRKGREDCDGRAVLAASLLRRMGYEAHLANDILHTWVVTPVGATMSPGSGAVTLVGQAGGTRTQLSLALVTNAARGLSFGIAVFPLGRELIILAALCGLTLQPRSSVGRRILGCLLMAAALGLFRVAGEDAARYGRPDQVLLTALATLTALAGWLLLAIRARGRRQRFPPERPGSPAGHDAGLD